MSQYWIFKEQAVNILVLIYKLTLSDIFQSQYNLSLHDPLPSSFWADTEIKAGAKTHHDNKAWR